MSKYLRPLAFVALAIGLHGVSSDNAFLSLVFGSLYGLLWNEANNRKRIAELEQAREAYERYIEKYNIKP